MTVKIIAENILVPGDLSSATEQEGEFIEQPIPASDNAGAFRLLSSGDIADLSYSGTATTDGAAGGTTIIDSVLVLYGDDYFIGGTVAVTDFLQDSADYTEQDVPGRLALTSANKITLTGLDDDEEVWLVIDKTAAHFSGDFEFHTNINCTANAAASDTCGLWAVANTVDTLTDIDAASGDYHAVYWEENGGLDYIKLEECNGGALTVDTSVAVSKATEYFLKIKRDETVGTYGTLYCYIYTTSIGGTLVDTLTVTLTEKQDFQHLYWMVAKEAGNTGAAWNGTIQNFEIVKSESKAVSDFAQTTGTLTTAAFTYQVNIGTSFILTVPFSTRDYRVELVAGGDAGDATFKWSHDGGSTYFGRDDPNQADWTAEREISGTSGGKPFAIVQTVSGDLLCLFANSADANSISYTRSTDKGITWGTATRIAVNNNTPFDAIVLKSGRILFCVGAGVGSIKLYYSDDNGTSWSSSNVTVASGAVQALSMFGLIELPNGTIAGVSGVASAVYFSSSTDGGFSWSAEITVASDANAQGMPAIAQAENGDLICVYETDEDSIGDNEIKCKISTDNGATWGSAIDVIDFGNDITDPAIIRDIDGKLFVVAEDAAANDKIVYTVSADNGVTWAAVADLKAVGATDLNEPALLLIDNHRIMCAYNDATNADIDYVHRGYWEVFSANACPCAIGAIKQELICDVGLVWQGGAGIAADDWTFAADYDYSMKNLISDSPSKSWRSEQDGIACNIVIDMGANERFRATGAAFFGCNIRALDFQMSTDNEWGTPDVADETISFNLVTGTLESNDGNFLQDDSVLANYKDHELKNKYLRMTAGTLDDTTWKLKDNVGNYFVVDAANADISGLSTDNFEVFQSAIASTFAGGNARYLNIAIVAHTTADGYYEIGSMVAGEAISLDRDWGIGYAKEIKDDIEILRTPGGGMIPIKRSENKRIFEVSWNISEDAREEIVALKNYLDGKNLALIPDHSTLTDCYLVKLIGGIRQQHVFNNKFNFSMVFEEVL